MNQPSWAQRPPPPGQGGIWAWELASVAELPLARAELRHQLAGALPVEANDDFEERFLLAFEELASNGLRHGGRPVRARVVTTNQGLLIEVSDSLPEQPPTPAVDRDPAFGGLGLYLIARLTAAHGWYTAAGRKHVWACCQ